MSPSPYNQWLGKCEWGYHYWFGFKWGKTSPTVLSFLTGAAPVKNLAKMEFQRSFGLNRGLLSAERGESGGQTQKKPLFTEDEGSLHSTPFHPHHHNHVTTVNNEQGPGKKASLLPPRPFLLTALPAWMPGRLSHEESFEPSFSKITRAQEIWTHPDRMKQKRSDDSRRNAVG